MLPFFVYGTLLPRQPNFVLWRDAIERITPATLADATLFSMGHFPMMIESKGEMVKGALVEISAESYLPILQAIDDLEGYNPAKPASSLYRRQLVDASTQAGQIVTAWAYFGDEHRTYDCPPIGGDWVTFSADNRRAIDSWWRQQRVESWLTE